MKKLLLTALSVSIAGGLFASQDAVKTTPEVEVAAEEEESSLPFEAGFDVDIYTAYIYRNQAYNDRPVVQPCIWADFTALDPIYFGFYVWQNYDLTNRRRSDMRGEWNETDYNVHIGATVWSNEDESMSLTLEAGHEWFVSNVKSEYSKDYASACEIYLNAEFETPYITPYGRISRMYRYSDGTHYEAGLKHEMVLCEEMPFGESLSLGIDWNVNFGSGKYLDYLYGEFERGSKGGIGGTTLKFSLTWQICENFSLGGVLAYTSLLNETIRGSYRDGGSDYYWGSHYDSDIVWGGVQAKLSF